MNKNLFNNILNIKTEINSLPKGYITTKTINGNTYYYHQWSENGKKYTKYLDEASLVILSEQISKRQELEAQLKLLKKGIEPNDVIQYTLMHLNIKVIDLYIDSNNGVIRNIGEIHTFDHLPIGTFDSKGNVIEKLLQEWWNNRSIPLSRSGAKEALEKLNISNPLILLLRCYGLSLSDQYWIKPKAKELTWQDINFFDNDFSQDVGRVLIGGGVDSDNIDLSSPDNTSIGNLKKRWEIINGHRMLLKGGSNPFRQEPFNEVIASHIANELSLDCVQYSLVYHDEYPYSLCLDFVNKDEDLITAYQINKLLIKSNNDSAYSHLIKCCEYLNIPGVSDYLDRLIVFDFIIANEDRHFNNFGFIRNAKTLEFIGPSIIFDSGASFGYDKINEDIKAFKNISSKPFNEKPLEQLKLVKSLSWLNVEKLENVKNIIRHDFSQFESKYLNKDRIDAIVTSCIERIDYLIDIKKKS